MLQGYQMFFPITGHAASGLSMSWPHDPTWKRPPSRPCAKWTDKLRDVNNKTPLQSSGDKLSAAVTREQCYGPSYSVLTMIMSDTSI